MCRRPVVNTQKKRRQAYFFSLFYRKFQNGLIPVAFVRLVPYNWFTPSARRTVQFEEGSDCMKNITLRCLLRLALLSALVFAASYVRITIPLPIDKAAVHLGNVACVLSGLLVGPLGGLSAAFGSAVFDLTNPLYAAEAPITFFNKFFIGFLAGLISHHRGREVLNQRWNAVGGVAGSLAYVILYMIKSWLFGVHLYGLQPAASLYTYVLPKLVTSLFNGAVAVVCAVPLASVIRSALKKSGLPI
jgi:uncharacterized membrane protein